jgi:hypothetical protein
LSGETARDESGWTPTTLKVLQDEKIDALARLTEAGFERIDARHEDFVVRMELTRAAAQLAQDKFEATVERDSVKQNEFRGSLDDLSKLMATRRESETAFQSVNNRIDDLVKQVGDLRSRLDVGPIGLQQLQGRIDVSAGEREGADRQRMFIMALVGLVITVLVFWGATHTSRPVVVTPTVTVPASTK